LYYVPETGAYSISGSAELFPQHCQIPNLSHFAHLKALTEEMKMSTGVAARMHKGWQLIKGLRKALNDILTPAPSKEQRVDTASDNVAPVCKRDDHLLITRISNAPAIMQTHDPTAKRNLIKTTRIHCRQTRNDTPGTVPAIQRVEPTVIPPDASSTKGK
jgi:hypothetical protein